jgi:DNA-binding beta-propeller fold protein YncE
MLNSRVVEYSAPLSNYMEPSLVLGDSKASQYCENHGRTSASTFCHPSGVTFDSEGNLWVADQGNNGVLEFAPPFSSHMAAKLEFGQPTDTVFTSNLHQQIEGERHPPQKATDSQNTPDICLPDSDSCSASTLWGPRSVAFDADGNVWVADEYNSRALWFTPPFGNGRAAMTVIGEEDFAHKGLGAPYQGQGPVSAKTISDAAAVALDSEGNLVVVDRLENRVLLYSPPFRNGMAATWVLGSSDFDDTNLGPSGRKLLKRAVNANLLNRPSCILLF